MIILHQCTVPDTPESTKQGTMNCVHCDKQMEQGDSFTTRADGYFKRHEYTPCNVLYEDKDCDEV